MRVPASLVAVPLLAGAALGLLHADTSQPWLPLCAAAASLFAWMAAATYTAEGRSPECAGSIVVGCLVAGVSLGVSDGRTAYASSLARWFAERAAGARDEPIALDGVLRADGAVIEPGATLAIDVERVRALDAAASTRVAGGVRLSVSGAVRVEQLREWRSGRRVVLPALLRLPTTYRNPGLADDSRALARRGISLVGTVKSAALVDVTRKGNAIDETAAAARAWTRLQLARFVGPWGGPSAGVATAILIGDRTGLPEEDERRLQASGTYHVIAISGGNIAILAALLLGAARLVHAPPRLAAAVTIVLLVFYGTLAGAGASVTRAVAAAVIYLFARILDHRGPALNALCVAASGAIAVSAVSVFDAGFILSFGATLGILVGVPRLIDTARARTATARLASAATTLLVTTVCAELALAPAGAVIFSRITFAGLILNFAAIPLMAVTQAAALATLALAPVSPGAASACGYVVHLAASSLVRSAHLVDVAPWLARDVPPPAWWLMACYYAAALVAVAMPRRARRAMVATLLCLALMVWAPAFATTAHVPAVPAGGMRIVFFDVGQGDATAVMLPNGRTILVDAGGGASTTFDIGARVVAPALRAVGVRSLDSLAITHADPDHVGGAGSILRAFWPGSIWEGVPVPHDPALQELAALARAHRASWRVLQAGDFQREGNVEIRVLHPPVPDWERQRVRNDDSLVLEFRIGLVSVVLPGDIERAAEQTLLPHISLAPLVVLKAPHHGSATSSTTPLLDAVNPRAVIFSAGQNNRYGHPAPQVVARYAARGVEMFGTAEDGAVFLDTDGKQVVIWTWASGRVWERRIDDSRPGLTWRTE